MTRPVNEVVADLRRIADAHAVNPGLIDATKFYREAADLLERLDADNENLEAISFNLNAAVAKHREGFQAVHDALPTCPTCGGVQSSPSDHVRQLPRLRQRQGRHQEVGRVVDGCHGPRV